MAGGQDERRDFSIEWSPFVLSSSKDERAGFSLIEIIIVIAIIAILGAVVAPQLGRRDVNEVRRFVGQLNGLMTFVSANAAATGQVHKVLLDLEHDVVTVERALGGKAITGEDAYEPLANQYMAARVVIPQALVFRSMVINGADELAGAPTKKVWFFCVPQGLCQSAVLTGRDTERDEDFVLTLNPYTGQFART